MQGKFIVIEGTDGSGKTAQFELLKDRLQNGGNKVALFDFPQYENPSAHFAKKYLRGEYGTFEEIGPYKASLFFALDRFEASFRMREEMEKGKIILSNRYVGSNMGHQGAKIDSRAGREKFFRWLRDIEFETLGIPRAHLNIILHVPAQLAQKLVDEKGHRYYVGGAKRDLHEENLEHLKQSEEVYLEMAELFPDKFTVVECMDGDRLMNKEEIHERVWNLVKNELEI